MITNKNLIGLIFLCVSFTILRCKTTHNPPSMKEQYNMIYTNQFKLTYFRNMLKKSFNNSSAIKEVMHADHSGFAEPILTETDYKLIDSITTAHNELLILDSTKGYQRAEGAQGKRPLGFIMEKLSSKWLDSLAKKRTKLSGIPPSWLLD